MTALLVPTFFIFGTVLISLVLSVSFILDTRRTNKNNVVVGSSWKDLVGTKDTITCQEARRRVARGLWFDPNDGKQYYRPDLVTNPSFAVSVHTESYDPVRWEHIYVKGKYYEDLVHSRFLQILDGRSDDDDGNNHNEPSYNSASASASSSESHPTSPISLVVDIGANIGYYTLLSMSLGYSVLSFDINAPNILRMCESLKLNNWMLPENDKNNNKQQPIVRFYQQGMSDVDGENLEVLVPKNPGQAYMARKDEDPIWEENDQDEESAFETTRESQKNQSLHQRTTTITMDTFAEQHGWLIPLPDGSLGINTNIIIKILKIDVEGKEPHVIEGAQTLLRAGIIENILIEFRRLARPNVQQAMLVLLDTGYTLIDDKEGKVSITRATEILSDLTDQYQGTGKTVDLWFQRV
ncbi:hypothetical protein ACA910_016870 [Epithemia clementina (nom. ined.)]